MKKIRKTTALKMTRLAELPNRQAEGTVMRTTQTLVLLSMLSLAFTATAQSAPADPADIVQHGNARGALACMTCHGEEGEGNAASGFPRLAGLNAGYLHAQLEAFAIGARVNAMMSPVAQALSPAERKQLAQYYGGLGRPVDTVKSAPQQPDAEHKNPDSPGAQLALRGRWEDGLPACTQCHGALGVGVGPTFPALTGQSALYIENQLRAWQQGTRPPGPLALMQVVASKLSLSDIEAVAAYFSALPTRDSSRPKPP